MTRRPDGLSFEEAGAWSEEPAIGRNPSSGVVVRSPVTYEHVFSVLSKITQTARSIKPAPVDVGRTELLRSLNRDLFWCKLQARGVPVGPHGEITIPPEFMEEWRQLNAQR